MNRRDSIKKLALSSGALIVLPSWASQWTLPGLLNHASTFTPTEQAMLASVVDTIIPQGNAIGGLAVGVDKFLEKLIDDCYEPTVQENVKHQLAALDTLANTTHHQSFVQCHQQEREEMLLTLSSSADKNEKDFFDLMKSETIRGFNTSKEVLVNYQKFKLVPGHYNGCVDVKS
jgi:Gluconate 2-dehydrogenase subunit 3